MDEIIALYESQLVGLFDEAGHAYSEAARQEVLARIAWRALALTWPVSFDYFIDKALSSRRRSGN